MRKRIEDTGRSLKMLQTFIQERAALEEQYAASLRELLKRHAAPFPDPWSTSEAWKALRAEADETQRVHQQLSQQLATEVARPLEYFHRQQSQSSKLVRAPIDVSRRCVCARSWILIRAAVARRTANQRGRQEHQGAHATRTQVEDRMSSTGSLSLARSCIRSYGCATNQSIDQLRDAYHKCGNQAVVAQKALEAAKASKTSQAVGKVRRGDGGEGMRLAANLRARRASRCSTVFEQG